MEIGDIVYSEKYGKGRIIEFVEGTQTPYGVEFYWRNSDLHDLVGRCEDGYGCWCTDDNNWERPDEIISVFTMKFLEPGDKLITSDGAELIFNGREESLTVIGNKKTKKLSSADELNENLTMINRGCSIDDIEEVRRPINYKIVFTRGEPKEMTIAEIEELLGYPIKVVKKG